MDGASFDRLTRASTDYAATQLAARPCAPSLLAALPACSRVSGQRRLARPAPSGAAHAHATESAAVIQIATSSSMRSWAPVTATVIAAAAGRTRRVPASATAARD